jgi:RNA polymerase sigma-70 factor (ECF subfamily)
MLTAKTCAHLHEGDFGDWRFLMTTVAKLDKRQYSAPQSTVHVRHPRGTLRWGTVGRYATADGTHGSSDLNDAAEIFTAVRPRLFGVAYRMLGGVADAEDIVQDVWLRWQTCDRGAVRDATAFLMTATTRLCINTLQSAHARRETHAGPWLPEPVDTGADPSLDAERAEALKVATSMLLEKLPPAERAAYILREAFDYPYELIARTIRVTDVNARQLVSRARKHLATDRCESTSPADRHRLLTAFVTAARAGDMAALENVLVSDAVA